MPSRTWTLTKDASTAGGAVDLGNGVEQHAPIGLWSGWLYRYFAQYNVDLTGIASITSATLHMRSSSQVHVGFGSAPSILIARLGSSFSGTGGSEGSWSGSASPKSSTQPSGAGSELGPFSMTKTQSTWDTADITAIAQAWLSGSTNYGIRIRGGSEISGSAVWEFGAQAGSYDSYITIVYVATSTANPPVAAPLKPLTGEVANLDYAAGSGWASPRPTVSWSFSDPDTGSSQASFQVLVYSDLAGSPSTLLYDSGQVSPAKGLPSPTSLQPPMSFTEGSYYHWQVRVWDNTGLVSSYTATQRFRVRWGAAEYYGDLGAAPSALTVSALDATGKVVVEYNSSTDAADPGASIGTWVSTIAATVKRRYVRYRVWLLPSTIGAPALNQITFSYSATGVPTPDNWTMVGTAQATTETVVYGTKSLRLAVNDKATQVVPVLPNTIYQLSGRVKVAVPGGTATGIVALDALGNELVRVPASSTSVDWTGIDGQFNSGSNLSVTILCDNTSGLGNAWFDALKLEASDTPTPWLPAVIGSATALDASGVKIDATAGGSLRLTGSTGGARDVVDLGAHGIRLGAESGLEISSPSAGHIQAAGALDVTGVLTAGGTAVPRIVTGSVTMTITASTTGTQAISFGVTFASAPAVFLIGTAQIAALAYNLSVTSVTTTGCTANARHIDAASTSTSFTVQWMAVL